MASSDPRVVQFRLEQGLCVDCGSKIYGVSVDCETKERTYKALTIEGVVSAGRCLHCHPDVPTPVTVMKDEKRAAVSRDTAGEERSANYTAARQEQPNTNNDNGLDDCMPDDSPSNANLVSPMATRNVPAAAARRQQHNDLQQEKESDAPVRKKSPPRKMASRKRLHQGSSSSSRVIRPGFRCVAAVEHGSEEDDDNEAEEIATSPSAEEEEEEDRPEAKKARSSRATSNNSRRKKKDPLRLTIADDKGVRYEGVILEGNSKQGKGSFKHVHKDGEHKGKVATYVGEYHNGKLHGEGIQKSASGCHYQGAFSKGSAHGHGKCTWPEGWFYEGEWVNDAREGYGRCGQKEDDGETYEGMWKQDKWHVRTVQEFY